MPDDENKELGSIPKPPLYSNPAAHEQPPVVRLTQTEAVGQEYLPANAQARVEAGLQGAGANMEQPPFVPTRSVAEIEDEQRKLEAEIGDGGPSQTPKTTSPLSPPVEQTTSAPQPTTRREFLTRVAVPVAVVGAAVVKGEPEKAKHTFDFLEAFGRFFGQKKDQAAAEIALTWQQMADKLAQTQLSDDQQRALETLKITPPEKLLHNLEVDPNGAPLRRNPRTIVPDADQMNNKINYIGKLAPGTKVQDALLIEDGEDPNHPTDTRYKSNWYFIPTPDGKRGAFAWAANFKNPTIPQPQTR